MDHHRVRLAAEKVGELFLGPTDQALLAVGDVEGLGAMGTPVGMRSMRLMYPSAIRRPDPDCPAGPP
jgi:hypothetical protein